MNLISSLIRWSSTPKPTKSLIALTHIGHATIHTPSNHDIHLRNILHVPEAQKNLISVHRLATDNNAFLEFHPNYFLVKDRDTKKVILEGECRHGLYPFPAPSNKKAYIATKVPFSRWHSRLGHPSSAIVTQVISRNKLPLLGEASCSLVCDACQQAKSHQLPYTRSDSKSSSPLELIFSDVWGPAIESVGRYRYYVSFIDDFSKFTWIYLIKHKSDVFHKFQDFQAMVERQFNKKILAVQSDWGGEYERLNSFFTKIGIMHHVSCPRTHQQNGAAERKHRHIVEVGLSLLSYASMPLKYWDEAFIVAVHLINRLPSRVIHFTTPLERLSNQKPDYSSMRTFGCACWPHLRPYNSHKLQFRSKQCIFLGYSVLHKGFKCLDVASGRIYVSRDVIFDETVYPFSHLNPNDGV
jgi:hypothetical protein